MANKKPVLTTEDALRIIEKTVTEGKHEADLRGLVFDRLDLTDRVIPVSLDFTGSTCSGIVNLCRSKFLGNYIEFEKATLWGGLYLNSLSSEQGYSLYLYKTKITGEIELEYTSLNWLCIGGLVHRDDKHGNYQQIRLRGTTFMHGISWRRYR